MTNEISEKSIEKFLTEIFKNDEKTKQAFLIAKEKSELDWITLIRESIQDWIRIDKEENSYRWEE